MPTDRALRPFCSRYIRARGAGPPEAIGEAGGAALEIDRHTLQLSEACPAVATSLRVMNSHVDISRLAFSCYALLVHSASPEQFGLPGRRLMST